MYTAISIKVKFIHLLAVPSSLSRSYSTFPLCSGDNLNWNSCMYRYWLLFLHYLCLCYQSFDRFIRHALALGIHCRSTAQILRKLYQISIITFHGNLSSLYKTLHLRTKLSCIAVYWFRMGTNITLSDLNCTLGNPHWVLILVLAPHSKTFKMCTAIHIFNN